MDKLDALVTELNAYTEELEGLIAKMERSNFPFADASLIYAEVKDRLKKIMQETNCK